MKYFRYFLLATVLTAICATAAVAQRKSTRKSATKKPVSTKGYLPPLEVRSAREKVDIQLSNVTKFVDQLGPIAQAMETLDASSKTKRLSQKTLNDIENNKKKVVVAIRNLKIGLSTLESEFRTKPILKEYLKSIEGITDLTELSEDAAIAGNFVDAKGPLRDVAKKLNDTLAMMPASPPL